MFNIFKKKQPPKTTIKLYIPKDKRLEFYLKKYDVERSETGRYVFWAFIEKIFPQIINVPSGKMNTGGCVLNPYIEVEYDNDGPTRKSYI